MLLSFKDYSEATGLFSLEPDGQRHQLPLAGMLPPPHWHPGPLGTVTFTVPARVCSSPRSGLTARGQRPAEAREDPLLPFRS